ncbi:hypothetical protein Acsp01_63250 [Actinoplanes sp. NBRC 101535]|nr:hypothetical protein Acsp01_63250 [Actinoplanes sp. NBRC 101535]
MRSAADGQSRSDGASLRVGSVLLDRPFGQTDITVLRHAVTRALTHVALDSDRVHGYVLSINEIITNVVLHAGGTGRLVLRVEDDSVWCVVTDSGAGIPGDRLEEPQAPDGLDIGGRGLWLTHQLCDEVTTATGPIGTSIGLRMALEAVPDSSRNSRSADR